MGHLGHSKMCARCAEHWHAMRGSALYSRSFEKLPSSGRWLRWAGNILPREIGVTLVLRNDELVLKYLEHMCVRIDEGLDAIIPLVADRTIGQAKSDLHCHRVAFLCSVCSGRQSWMMGEGLRRDPWFPFFIP